MKCILKSVVATILSVIHFLPLLGQLSLDPFELVNRSRCHESQNLHNDKFSGWWYATTQGYQYGFNANGFDFAQASLDQYIYIDTSVYPVQITSVYGTDQFPRLQPDALDSVAPPVDPSLPTIPTNTSFLYQGNNKLVNAYLPPFKGPVDVVQSQYDVGGTLQLIDDHTLHAFTYVNNGYDGSGDVGILMVYKKMESAPEDTSGFDWNNPLNMFLYYVSANTFQNNATNPRTKSALYVGAKKAKKIVDRFLQGTFTKTTPLRKLRVTNLTNYADIGISNDRWTTIYTGDPSTGKGIYSYATPGSNVTISGATGDLSILNGTYPNGVGALNGGMNLGLKHKFVDNGPNGSYNDLFNSFLLNLDTSSLALLADPATGFIDLPTGITVTVNHSINPSSSYNEFCASCAAWFYAVFGNGTHISRELFAFPNSCQVIDTFANLQTALAGNLYSTIIDSQHWGQGLVNGFYHNSYDFNDSLYQSMVNCPYRINLSNPLFGYDVVLGNYLTNVQNLFFTIKGELESDQPDPVSAYGYPFIYDPSAGRAHFEGLVAPATVNNGIIQTNVPSGYATLGDFGDDFSNLNSYYFGQIDPSLTGGKVIGYLYKRDCAFLDPYYLMDIIGIYTKDHPNKTKNPRNTREGMSAVFSKMMEWFNSIGCETIIIDQTSNGGGFSDIFSISEFMGADRTGYHYYTVPKDPAKDLFSYNRTKTVGNCGAKIFNTSGYMHVSLNEKFYPGSVFKGSKDQKKKVIFLTDVFSWSEGDISPNFFIGDKGDNYLGHNTYAEIVGCVDGREFGFYDLSYLPVNTNPATIANNLVYADGSPASAMTYTRDNGVEFAKYCSLKLSALVQNKGIKPVGTPIRGTSGSKALPISYEKTLFQDFGYTPLTRPLLPGWSGTPVQDDPTTWPFLYLDAAIMRALE